MCRVSLEGVEDGQKRSEIQLPDHQLKTESNQSLAEEPRLGRCKGEQRANADHAAGQLVNGLPSLTTR